ncbi:MAG: hypothetical protein RIS44_1569 [Pseudomonadota bacterium]|jgi:hypothetical protein
MTTPTRAERGTKSSSGAGAFLAALTGLLCLVLSCTLAYHHPLSPAWAAASVAVLVGLGVRQPRCIWWLPPALLPLIGLAPWTGWIVFEEFDLLLLALLAGGYARLVFSNRQAEAGAAAQGQKSRRHRGSPQGAYALVALTALLFAASVLISMFRGFEDAGGFSFGWFQGYHEPMNSLRLAKPFFLALLWWPLWRAAQRTSPDASNESLSLGLLLGMATVGLIALWERLAFTGLLNFSTDYRITALFWEMHVGGAALDGFLALTVPFVLRELMLARSSRRWILAAGVMLLAAYVSLTTFSRGVYLAVPLSLGLTAWLHTRQVAWGGTNASPATGTTATLDSGTGRGTGWGSSLAWVVLFMALATWMFPSSGYRGMLALLGSLGLLMLMLPRLRLLGTSQWASACFGGALLSACAWGVAWFVPKGAYIAYALVATGTAMTLAMGYFRPTQSPTIRSNVLAAMGMLGTWAAMVAVAMHWGGDAAAERAAVVALGLLLLMPTLLLLRRRKQIQGHASNTSWRSQLAVLGTMAISGALVAVFAGGAYMGERFSTGGKDFGGRMLRWQGILDNLHDTSEWAWGKGTGRLVATLFNNSSDRGRSGDFRRQYDGSKAYLAMSAGQHIIGWGELLRVSQRTVAPSGLVDLSLQVRTQQATLLQFELCEKHLLYSAACLSKRVEVKPVKGTGPTAWQPVQVRLELAGSRVPSSGHWYAPRLIVFSMGAARSGQRVDVTDLALTDATGQSLLQNGDFSRDLMRWFFTSDLFHGPWRIDSVMIHLLLEQGWVGTLLWLILASGALWRVSAGTARSNNLGPAVAGAILGFFLVGASSSLLESPRIMSLYYLLVLVGLTIRPSEPNRGDFR